jgi:Rps23 Pro-64 3,4-dihydroxylase Tpa1-like proline 4-hydroxylase
MNTIALEKPSNQNIERWHQLLTQQQEGFLNNKPFPYLIVDDFLSTIEARKAARSFPNSDEGLWTNYIHVNEKKYGLNKRALIPPALLNIIDDLQSNSYLKILEKTTSLSGLIADGDLAGAGLHQMHPGGFLNIHSDFLIHPTKKNLKRKLNLILFLSDDWEASYGGELQLWNREMTECVVRIQPKFNRCVMFLTDEYSYHGCPDKLKGPKQFSRKSLALYYYISCDTLPSKYYTDYKARPEDKDKRFAIFLDNKAVAIYSWLKQCLKLNDDFISRFLRFMKWY